MLHQEGSREWKAESGELGTVTIAADDIFIGFAQLLLNVNKQQVS